MKKIIISLCLGISALVAQAGYANDFILGEPTGISKNYDFQPNVPEILSNPLLWSLDAVCLFTTNDESDVLIFDALKHSGTIGGTPIVVGTAIHFTVKSGISTPIHVESSAKIRVTNTGQNTVHAICTIV